MRRTLVLAVMLLALTIAHAQEEDLPDAAGSFGGAVLLISSDAKPQGTTIRIIHRTVGPASVLGRRFGPFDAEPRPISFPVPVLLKSLIEDNFADMADLNARVSAAMAIHCPRMRQLALQSILVGGGSGVPRQTLPADFDASVSSRSVESGSARLRPTWPAHPMEPGSVARGFNGREAAVTRDSMKMGHRPMMPRRPVRGPSFDVQPVLGGPHRPQLLAMMRHAQGTRKDASIDEDETMDDVLRMMENDGMVFEHLDDGYYGDEEETAFEWRLWNVDGSLNWGLVLFAALSAACACVWSALIMQCLSCGHQDDDELFYYSDEDYSDNEDVDDPKAALKRGVVVAAEYVPVKEGYEGTGQFVVLRTEEK